MSTRDSLKQAGAVVTLLAIAAFGMLFLLWGIITGDLVPSVLGGALVVAALVGLGKLVHDAARQLERRPPGS